jgi:HEAT repeat protein
MYQDLFLISAILGVATVPYVVFLLGRRVVLARREGRVGELEQRMVPRALAIVQGDERPEDLDLEADELAALASVLARYSRLLDGEAKGAIVAFFEQRGLVDRQARDLRSRRAWRRARAAHVLGDIGSLAAVPELIGALGDKDAEVRSAAARSLGRLRAQSAVGPLVDALSAGRLPVSAVGGAQLAIGPVAVDEVAAMSRARGTTVRRLAVELIAQRGEPRHAPLLLAALDDPVPDVRAKACRAAGRIGSQALLERLTGMLDDRSASVRAAAASALGIAGGLQAGEPLLYLARWDEFNPARAAARALAQIDPQAVLDAAAQPSAGPHLTEESDRIAAGVF